MRQIILICVCSALSAHALEPWDSDTHPSDVATNHAELITDSPATYSIVMAGTMDGENCRSPIGYQPWQQTWEGNRSVRMENIGTNVIVNPWLSNGRNAARTIEEIIEQIVQPEMSDAERARRIWEWHRRQRFHMWAMDEALDPIKAYHIYGYTLCHEDASVLAGMWKSAGLTVRAAQLEGHVVTEVFYHNRWNLLDGDEHNIFLLRDNQTPANYSVLGKDHDLVKRFHCFGLLCTDFRFRDEAAASFYAHENDTFIDRDCARGHNMLFNLRPGEALVWRWGRLDPLKYHGKWEWEMYWSNNIANGLWEYAPLLTNGLWAFDAVFSNVEESAEGLTASGPDSGTVIWPMAAPYVIVGGTLDFDAAGVAFSLSFDGSDWQPISTNFDSAFPPDGEARYAYYLRAEFSAGGVLRMLRVQNDLQMAPLNLPGVKIGENEFVYSDDNGDAGRMVRITHEWVERALSLPPMPPAAPVFPPDGADADGTKIVFEWLPAEDPDGDAIADYHFELSEYPDMRWPLSPNFEKLISRTADAGLPRYSMPYDGLLNPEQTYYWRVRAKDSCGVWGEWSTVWRFTPRGPGCPLNVHLEIDPASGIGVLHWTVNPNGRPPAYYRVYGSDEKGFSISDTPYEVYLGNQPEPSVSSPFPANFIATTENAALAVLGPAVTLDNANKAFYRVVAVDAYGVTSGPSDYAAAPRPFIYTPLAVNTEINKPFSLQLASIRSIGDLQCRWFPTNDTWYQMNFWDVEYPVYSVESGPAWLSLDPATGLLQGCPSAAGVFTATVSAAISGIGTDIRNVVVSVAPTALPATPGNLSAKSGLVDYVELVWTVEPQAEYYEIWRNTVADIAGAVLLGEVRDSLFRDTDATHGRVFYYWVRAVNRLGASDWAGPVAGWSSSPAASNRGGLDLHAAGAAEFALYYEPLGVWVVSNPDGGFSTVYWGGPGMTPVPGDYDGDGRADFAVYHEQTGLWFIKNADGSVLAWSAAWGGPGMTPVPGDYDGDYRSDMAVYHQQSGLWFVASLNAAQQPQQCSIKHSELLNTDHCTLNTGSVLRILVWAEAWGGPGLQPVPGDYDGNGVSDFCVYDMVGGRWYVLSDAGQVLAWAVGWGGAGFVPVWGDYDGDGRSDMAVYDFVAGRWYVLSVNRRVVLWAEAWGGPDMVPVPGDYDGDGASDLALYYEAGGLWYIKSCVGGGVICFGEPFGGAGFVPLW